MSFTDPRSVISPKANVSDVRLLLTTGEGGWSLASLRWNGQPAIGIRWNGEEANPIGMPQSRGIATWFLVPEELQGAILSTITGRDTKPFSFDHWDPSITRVRLRPLPKRFWVGTEQEPMDFVWNVERHDQDRGAIILTNPATGHRIPLYAAHIRNVTPDLASDQPGGQSAFLNLTVQMIFRDTNVSLEPLPDTIRALREGRPFRI